MLETEIFIQENQFQNHTDGQVMPFGDIDLSQHWLR